MSYTSTENVSAASTRADPRLQKLRMVPLGAAVWTSSGDLAQQGITAIAQAASGAMAKHGQGFDPTRASVEACIANSFHLAASQGHDSLALPFIAGGIFLHRIEPVISQQELATLIVEACVRHRGSLEAVIVAFGETDVCYFENSLKGLEDPAVTLVEGSITSYQHHGCAAIVNAANMEVVFGGGVSGIIGRATGQAQAIDEEAAGYVEEFWAVNGAGA